MTLAVNIAQGGSNNVTFRNRIINGAMVIDQRNAGASLTPSNGTYSLDRWNCGLSQASKYTVQQNAGSLTGTNLPSGFTNYLGATVGASANVTVGSTDYFFLNQKIEGYNTADLNWGFSNAKTVTLSFWVRSSLTGTFGGSIYNSAADRSYPFNYTISSANTWEQKTITIVGDTTGTWLTTNGIGMTVLFALGYGSTYLGTANTWQSGFYGAPTGSVNWITTNSATFYITGVQLEAGTTASPFEYRQYGTELALCQRYYYKWGFAAGGTIIYQTTMHNINATGAYGSFFLPVVMRANPTLTTSGSAGDYGAYQGATTITCNSVPAIDTAHPQTPLLNYNYASATLTAAGTSLSRGVNTSGFLGFNAEL